MPLNYPPVVALASYFRLTAGHDVNPSAQVLIGQDEQLFVTFDNLASNVMANAGLAGQLKPIVILLVAMAPPGLNPVQQVQLACLFLRNALIALNHPTATLADLVEPAEAPVALATAALGLGAPTALTMAAAVGGATSTKKGSKKKGGKKSPK